MGKNELVYETCLLIVRHFKNLVAHDGYGFNTRIFSHMLYPEKEFVFLGFSTKLKSGEPHHPEHVVPCAVLIAECRRLIANKLPDEDIARLLQKHWKVAHITKEQAKKLDQDLGLKSSMPPGWDFESGDTSARLKQAEIVLANC